MNTGPTFAAEVAVVLAITLALVLGAIPGAWAGWRGHERGSGRNWIIAVVALVALVGLFLYTIAGPSDQLFTRLVILPLSLVIAVAASAVLVGAPMYAGFVLAFRVAQSAAGRPGGGGGSTAP